MCSPCTICQALLHTSVDVGSGTSLNIVQVTLTTVGALTISSSTTAARAIVGLVVTTTTDGVITTEIACVADTVVIPWSFTARALTPSLRCTLHSRAIGIQTIVNFHIGEARAISSTEVVATRGATIATCATAVAITDVAVVTASQVRVEVVPSAPSRTVATTIVLIGTVAIVGVLVVIGQREQEVAAVTRVTVTGTPRRCSVATNQSTGVQLDNRNRRAFAVASAMERRRTSTVNGALVTQRPSLVSVPYPSVDARLVGVIQEVTTVEQRPV